MRLLLKPSSAFTYKIPAWFTYGNCCHRLTNPQVILGINLHSQRVFPEMCDLSQKRHISRCMRKPSSWQRLNCCKYERVWHMVGQSCSSFRRLSCRSSSTLLGQIDRHQGVWVDLSKPGEDGFILDQLSEGEFDNLLKASLDTWKGQGVTSTWLHLSLTQGKFISVASKYGFTFHHAEGNQATLVLWMGEGQESKVPIFATHQVGVSGVVINENTKEILVVMDKNRPFQLWKFPGGLSDLGEDLAATAEREVFEETGLKTEFQSVLAFRQHHSLPGAFGRSDLYIICRLKPLTFDLHPCEEEIAACKWMSVENLKQEVQASTMTHKMADLILMGMKNGFADVDITSHEMVSLYKGLKFHIFHRPIQ